MKQTHKLRNGVTKGKVVIELVDVIEGPYKYLPNEYDKNGQCHFCGLPLTKVKPENPISILVCAKCRKDHPELEKA